MTEFEDLFGAPTKEEDNNVLMIDFSHLAHRTIHAANFKAQKEFLAPEELFAFWRHLIITSLFKEISKKSYKKVVIAYDSAPYWRKLLYPEYKGKRKQQRKESSLDYGAFMEVLNEFEESFRDCFKNFVHLKHESIEADDIIACLVKELHTSINITIVTGDGDYKQLLKYPNVTLYDPIKKKEISPLNVEKELQLKVILGDTSDNIPAIKPKVGPKTAEKIYNKGIEEYLVEEGRDIRKQYDLNKKLIDFEMIPKMIYDTILNAYKNYKTNQYSFDSAIDFCNKYELVACHKKFMNEWSTMLASIC